MVGLNSYGYISRSAIISLIVTGECITAVKGNDVYRLHQ